MLDMLTNISLAELSLFFFTIFNALRIVSYLPQILRIAQDCQGAQAISYIAWGLWVAANGSTAAYAWVNLKDLPLALLNGGNTICCITVIALTAYKRHAFKRRARLQGETFAMAAQPSEQVPS
jgi:hypothetical protein